MFDKIIVGCDGTAAGRDALALAQALGGGAELLAVGVYPDPLLPFPVVLSDHATAHEECERLLRADRDRAAPGARVRAVASSSPAHALYRVVAGERADLLVLGSSHATEAGSVKAGRHARQLLHDVPCAVALAPAGFAETHAGLQTVVAGFDPSPEAARALSVARDVAQAIGRPLRVITALETLPPVAVGWIDALAYQTRDVQDVAAFRAKEALKDLKAALADDPGATTDVLDGPAGEVLCTAPGADDLLVIGSRRWGPLARLILGGTGEYVVHHAHCPVLVAPRAASEHHQPTPPTPTPAAA